MPRVKSGVQTRKRRKKILKQAKGYFGSKRTLYRTANEQVMRSLNYAYISRRLRKRDFRKLWIQRINAACKLNGYKYSHLIHGLSLANVEINRKMLADMAVNDMAGFQELIEISKEAIANKQPKGKEAKVVVRKAKLAKPQTAKEEKPVKEEKLAKEEKPVKEEKPAKEEKVVEKPAKEEKVAEEKEVKEEKVVKEEKPAKEAVVEEDFEDEEELDEETLEGVETSDEDDDESDADHQGTDFVYHISQVRDDKSKHYRKWRVRRSGSKKTIKHFDTQKEAIVAAKRYATTNDTRIVVHRRDGRIRKSN